MSLKSKFCPRCGNEAKQLLSGLCEDCFKEKTPIGEVPERVVIQICPACRKYLKSGKWVKQSYIPGVIKDTIKGELKLGGRGRVKIMVNDDYREAKVRMQWYMDEEQMTPKEETYFVAVKLQKRLCDACFRKFGGYYESIIQFRGEKDEVLDAVEKVREIEDRSEMWFISKIEDTRGGVNLHLGSKDMDKEVERIFKLEAEEVKRSYSLVTKKDGRDVYRNTLLIRL